MSLRKKSLALLVGLLVVAILAGCSSDSSSSASKTLVVYGDTVADKVCVQSSRFTPGEKIIFRATAVDGATNEVVPDAMLEIVFNDGTTIPMKYGSHGDDNFWVGTFIVPEDFPTGPLGYKITATYGDKKGEFVPFNVAPSLLTIVAPEGQEG